MWSPCGKAIALLVAGLIPVEPPLLAAGGFERGQGTAQRPLDRFGTLDAIRGETSGVPNYTPENVDHATANPYYMEDAEASGLRARVGQDAGPLAESTPAGQVIRDRALSPWTWTFGDASQPVSGLERQFPSGASQEPGCLAVAYCAEPVMVQPLTLLGPDGQQVLDTRSTLYAQGELRAIESLSGWVITTDRRAAWPALKRRRASGDRSFRALRDRLRPMQGEGERGGEGLVPDGHFRPLASQSDRVEVRTGRSRGRRGGQRVAGRPPHARLEHLPERERLREHEGQPPLRREGGGPHVGTSRTYRVPR